MIQFVQPLKGYNANIRRLGLALALLLLSACTPPIKEDPPDERQVISTESINELLAEAASVTGKQRTSLVLEAAEGMYQLGELDWARITLSNLYPNALDDTHYFTYSMLAAQVAVAQGEHFIAKRILWDARFVDLFPSKPVAVLHAQELRAQLLCDLAEFRDCISERLIIDARYSMQPALNNEPRDLNLDKIWIALMELPLKDLQMESQMHSDPTAQGWYRLATLSKDNQTNMRLQLESVEDWVLRWPEHPASLRLPADLQLLKQLVDEQASHIAVLLPLSGKLEKASSAIRDGIMAAFYRLAETGDILPNLHFYDTAAGDISMIYDQAVLDGAELVIGPLDKANIDTLALRLDMPVPTLALNYGEHALGNTGQLFQFGLAVEDEAAQVAERAWRDGHRRAMILGPKSGWGDRAAATFSETWQSLGGAIVGDYRFKSQSEYSNLIRDAMDVTDSQQRARRMRQILNRALEFEPRQRKDVDLIFMVARPTQARQLKPTLAYHYAGDIPVYSTSHIYNGEIDSNADRDMNGIRFATLPWFFNQHTPEKQAIDEFANSASAYQRLYALGVDAFQLSPRLRQLELVRNAHYYGNTGKLGLDEQKRIVREQAWAQFIRGRAYIMPTVTARDAI
ncbi:penicillin-binding protein activator [Teredinibacter purpureus]|uniref:penicillin-binding protein activator n=1 Tax=Teredinibacter purpureus TaxID=2731756 RepID=UPI0005F88121|nr:penicillin-binding protein activator [Teredinibacter purpureus]